MEREVEMRASRSPNSARERKTAGVGLSGLLSGFYRLRLRVMTHSLILSLRSNSGWAGPEGLGPEGGKKMMFSSV